MASLLDSALNNFGNSILTQRETRVLQLILNDYAIKAITEKLEIRPEIVKHHVRTSIPNRMYILRERYSICL